MNYENQESYNRKQVVDLLSKVCNKYPNILNNRQFKNKHYSYVDLLGAFRLNSKHFDIKLE